MEITFSTEAISAVLGSATTLLTAAGAFHVKVIKPVLKGLKIIQKIEAELSTNGGLSIKDRITRIDDRLHFADARNRFQEDRDDTCIYECDKDGKCTFANKALCALYGLDKEEMAGKGWLTALDSDDRGHQWELWLQSINSEVPYEIAYIIRNRLTGRKFNVKTRARAVIGPDKKPIGYYGVVEEY